MTSLTLDAGVKRWIVIDWRIVERVSLLDWIAMYLLGEADPFNYLEAKNYGTGARHRGRIKWRLGKRMFREHGISSGRLTLENLLVGAPWVLNWGTRPQVILPSTVAQGMRTASICRLGARVLQVL